MLTVIDVQPFLDDSTNLPDEDIEARIRSVWVKAALAAPCINDPEFPYTDQVVAILAPAVARWIRVGVGGMATHQQSAGPFSQSVSFDNRYSDRLTRDEKSELVALCRQFRSQRRGRAFSVTPR